jgi:GINS complex subunit 1
MNFGQSGRDLLQELKRSDWLPPYNEEGVRAAIEEISLHYQEIKDIAVTAAAVGGAATKSTNEKQQQHQIPLQVKPAFLLHEASIQRTKRCLLAYHMYRLEKVKCLRWEKTVLTPNHKSLLSEAEIDFFSQYDELISNYFMNVGDSIFSPSALSSYPPDDYFVEVRVARSGVGRITTEDGKSVSLDVGTTHHLRRSDVEHLIRQGLLQPLQVEEY